MEEDGDLTELASAFGVKIDTPKKQPQGRGDDSVARVLDDEFSKLGYPATARTSILGDVGRENSWDRNTIFQGHPDPKNGAYNRGIISWQGDRQKALTDELKRQGVYGRGDDEELRGMARFMDSEMRSKYPDVYQQLRNPKTTAQASEALRRYINYVPTAPYNTPDPEFGVKNNREWALRAKELGLGNDPKPLDSLLEAFTGDNSSGLDSLDNAFAPNQQPDGQRPPTSAPLGPTDPTQAMQQPQAALPQDEPLPVQRQRMLDLSKKTNEELQRAKTPARRNILIKRLKDYNGMIGKLDQQIRAQANVPAPQTQEPSPEYTKPDANQPGQHWSFEASGKASYEKENDLNYLGVSNGKHYAKNSDGDTFEFDEASRQFKPTSPLRSKLKFEGGRTLTKKADNVYTDDQGDDYAVTATKGEDGSYSYDTKPVQPFTKQIRLEDGSELTRGEAIATGGYRYKDQDGVEYVYDKKGIRAAKPVNWMTDKAPAKLPLEKDTRFDEQKKADYNQLLNQYSLADTAARRQRFLTGQPLSKAEIAVLKNPEGAKVLSSRTEGDRQQQQGRPSTRVIRRSATEAEYDFVRKGGMMIPMSKDGPAQFLDYDKADQDGLDKGEYRLKDDQGHSLLYKPSTGEIQNEDEVNRNVAYQVPVQLASPGMDRSTAAVNQAGQVANAISEKIDVPAGDIIDFYKVNGFSDWKSGKDLPAERFYQSANFDPVTGLATESVDGKTPSTDTVYVTERDVQRMKNFSELKKRTESEYQAKVATYKNAGQSDYIAELRASADVGRANKAQAQAEIDAYNAALNQLPTEANYTKSLFADAKIGDPNALKPQSISNEEFLAYKIRKYGSITRMNQIKAAADALPIGDRIIEAGKDIAGIIPKMIGQVLKTAGSASAVVSRLSSGRFGGLMETQTDKTWLYQIGDAYEWVPDYVLPPDQLARESAIVSAADGIGQVGALIALTYVSGGQTLANVVGLSQGYASQYDEAKQAGRPENERLLIGVVGALAAMPDVWLRAKWFKGLTDPEKQVFMRKALAPIVSQLNERVGEVEARNIFGKGLAALYARAKSLGIKLAAPGEEEIVHPLTTWGAIKMVAAGTQFEGAQEVSEDKINDTAAKLVYNPNIQWSDILSLEDKNISSYIGGAFGGLGGAGAEIVGHPDAFRSYKERSEAYRALDEAFNVDGIEYKNGKKQFKLGSETFDITPEIEAELQKYSQNRKEIHNDEKQLVKLIQSARSAKTFAERKGILKDVKLASENLKELHEQKSDSVTKIYEMAGVADRIENTLGKPGDGKSETEVNTDKAARNMWNQVVSGLQENQDGIGMIPTPAETPTSAAPESATATPEPDPEKPAQAATPSTLTDKDGKQYEVLEDQGNQIKVQEVKPDGTKGSITRKPVRKFTNVEEFRQSQNGQPETTVSEPSTPVGEEPLVQDQGTTSPIKAENVTQPAANVKETPESKPKGPITLQGIQLKPQDGRPPQKFSNTQIQFNKEQSAPIEEFRNKVIDKADVAATEDLPSYANDGLKIDPHVTVKYGLHTNDAEDVSSLFKGEKPITLTLGKTAVFPGAEGGNYDVVIAEVDSPDLHALNKKVTNNAKVTETHPEYKPHVTIAYVKKGMGKKYAGRTDFEGQKYTFDGVTFSPADKSGKVQIPFKATAKPANTITSAFQDLGSGITENLNNYLWDLAEKGETSEAGNPSNLLILANEIRSKGGLQSKDEFAKFVQDFGDSVANRKGAELNSNARALVAKYQPPSAPSNEGQKQAMVGDDGLPTTAEGIKRAILSTESAIENGRSRGVNVRSYEQMFATLQKRLAEIETPVDTPTRKSFDNSLGIPRSEMPQISRTDMPAFLAFAKEKGVEITEEHVPISRLMPTQSEYNPKQAAQLPDEALKKPLMISQDYRVLDGHNIYARISEGNTKGKGIDVRAIHLPAAEALEFLKSFPKTTYKPVEHVGTAAKLAEHQAANPVDVNASQEEKARQLMALTAANKPIVEAILAKFRDIGLTHAEGLTKHNEKDFDKIIEKANRPEVKKTKPWHDVEHIRDAFRFRAGFTTFDQIPQMVQILRDAGLELQKIDTDKFMDPGAWGWRPVAIDIRMPNGQLVEFYSSFPQMIDAQYFKSEDHPVDNHDLYEKWRDTTPDYREQHREEFDKDVTDSAAVYQRAYEAGLAAAGLDETAARASFTKAIASLGSRKDFNSSDSGSDIAPRDQTPSADLTKDSTGGSDITQATGESSLETNANIKTSSNGSVTQKTEENAKTLSPAEKKRVAEIDKELLGFGSAMTMVSDAGGSVGEIMAEMKALREEKDAILGKAKTSVPADIRAIADASPNISIVRPNTQPTTPDFAAILAKKLEDEAEKARKASGIDINKKLKGLNDLFDLGLDTGSEEEPGQFKSVMKTAQPLDEAMYAKAKPVLDDALSAFEGATPEEQVNGLVDHLMSQGVSLDKIAEMQPYIVRFLEEKYLQSNENQSISEVEAQNDQPSDTRTDQRSSSEESVLDDDKRSAEDLGAGRPGTATKTGEERPSDAADTESDAGTGQRSGSTSGVDESGRVGLRDTPDGGVTPARSNFQITNELDFGSFSQKTRYRKNVEAIRLLNKLDEEQRQATPEEQSVLAQYVGWGGIKQAFDPKNKQWAAEYAELKELLPPGEYEKARRSVLNAHFTSKPVVDAIWKGLDRLGFKHGSILEPSMGIGNFFGLMPASMRGMSSLTGVELEPLTSKIAQHLYPNADIHTEKGFQDVYLAPGSIDVAIGNPPFGDEKIYDKNSKELSKLRIHAYFFAKSIDTLRPGGVLAMVVSKGFLDSRAPEAVEARKYVGKQADLVAAIRLPNTAFQDNANTEVVTDIIFLQKKGEGVQDRSTDWQEIAYLQDKKTGNPIPVNRYFAENPDMMLGTMTLEGTMYRADEPTLVPHENQDLEADLSDAIAKLPESIFVNRADEIATKTEDAAIREVSDHTGLRPFNFGVAKDGSIYQLEIDLNGRTSERAIPVSEANRPRVKALVDLRGTIREILGRESDESTQDADLTPIRERLNKQYDAFVKKYGYISSDTNKRLFRDDADYPLLQALEKDYDRGITADAAKKEGIEPRKPSAQKADIFTKRTVSPVRPLTSVDNAVDALIASLNNRGKLDFEYMSQLYSKSADAIIKELGDQVYNDPKKGEWVTSDEYLSGDVKTKLNEAKEAAIEHGKEFGRNVEALEKVIPADVGPSDIFIKLGSPWVPTDIYEQYVRETIAGSFAGSYIPSLGRFSGISIRSSNETLDKDTWGTQKAPASAKILPALMTNKQPQVMTPKLDENGNYVYKDNGELAMVVDQEQTAAAMGKAEALMDDFADWVWKDKDRRQRLTAIYNDRFNRRVKREYNGDHLTLPGLAKDMTLRQHIRNFVYRALQSGKALADHVVGAGKTPTAIATAMEMRRLGMAKKPTFVVPNHLVEQWAQEFKKFYPGANVLAATRNDFKKEKRKQLFAKIATGDWDAVIIAHSSFQFIPVPVEAEQQFIQEQINELQAAVDEARQAAGKKDRSVRDMEKALVKLEGKFKRLNDVRRDDLLNFQELGIDALFVDEAHEYKNLFFTTQKQGVGSLGDPAGSQKAFDMFMKTQMVLRKQNDRNVLFLTGTPVSNSLAEIFHMQRYLQYETLRKMGIANFDSWANTFGNDVQDWELNAAGKFRQKLRFVKFANLPELRQIWHEVADIITNDDIKAAAEAAGEVFKIPQVRRHKVIAKPSPQQQQYIGIPQPVLDEDGNPQIDEETGAPLEKYPEGTIIHRMENWKTLTYLKPDGTAGEENVLRITNDARKAGLDFRLIDPNAPDFAGSKINLAVNNILDIWKENADRKGTQLVFLDLSTPKKKRKKAVETKAAPDDDTIRDATLEDQEFDINEYLAAQSSFSAYDDIRDKLIARGVPANEIAFIHDYDTDLQKASLFAKVNRGDVRILLGSTKKMGAGTNVQKKLVASHNLDVPWKPSDLEQRNGRSIRQGNEFWTPDFHVDIFDYATEKTYDARMWEIVEQKGTALDRFRTGDEREVEDVSETSASAAEMKASATGDPRILESMQLKTDIKKLESQKKIYDRSKFDLESKMADFEGGNTREHIRLARFEDAERILKANPETENPQIELDHRNYALSDISAPNVEDIRNKVRDELNGKYDAADHDSYVAFTKAVKAETDKRLEAAQERYAQTRDAAAVGVTQVFRRAVKTETIVPLGTYKGFDFVVVPARSWGGAVVADLQLRVNNAPIVSSPYDAEQSLDPDIRGVITRIENMVAKLPEHKAAAQRDFDRKADEFEAAKTQTAGDFPKLAELNAKKERSAELLKELRASHATQRKAVAPTAEETDGEPGTFKFDDKPPADQQEKWEEIQNLPYEPMESVLDGAVMERRGDVLLPNAKSHELIRRAFEEVRIREAAAKGKKLKPGDYEDSFHGVFMDPGQVQKTVEVLREKADEAEKYDYPAEQVNTLRQHADDLEAAAAEGDGTAVVSVFDSALPEELFHQADYLGAANKSILRRHSAAATKALDASRIRSVLYQKHYSQFNEYKGLSPAMLNAIMRAEIAPFLLNSSDSDLAEYGITPDEADNYLLTWFEGYAEKNGVDSLQHFEREEINVQNFIKRVKESLTKTNGGGGKSNVSSGGQQTNVAGGETRGSPGSTTQSASETAGNEVDGGLFNTASLPGTLREGGLDADDIEYQIFGDRAANEEADKIIEELGVDGALDLIRRTDNQDVQHAIVSFKIQRAFLNRAEELENVDPAKAEEYRQSARTIAKEHALRAVASGRFTRAAQLVQQSIEHILYTAENLAAEYDRTLQPDQWERIEARGKELEATNAEMEAMAKQDKAQKRRIKRLEDEVAGIRKKRRSRSGQANRQATLSAVEAVQQSRQEALMEKLRAKLGKSEASESTEEPRNLKSVLKTDNTLDQETIDELAEVGAMMLMRGIVGEEEYLPHDFQAEMIAEFTDVIMPQFQQIYRKAWDIRDKWLNDLRRQNNVEEVKSEFGEDLDDWEIAEILGQKQARAKQRRAVEKWHQAMAGGKNARRDIDDYKRIINGLTDDPEIAFGAVLHAENTIPEVFYNELRKIGVTGANRQREIFRQGKAVFEKAKVERQIERDKIANELLAAKSAQQTISDLRWKARQRNRHAQNAIADELRRIKQGTLTYYGHQALSVTHAMRTLMASVDLSGAMRQGGFFMFSKPEAQAAAWVNMIKSVSEKGYGRVITEIEANALFTMAQRSGVDFAMAGRTEDYHNLQGEELFKGEQMIAKIPGIGPLIDKLAIAPSERTYTSVLDTQRMIMFDIFAKELMGLGLTFDRNANEFKKIADFINVATGRGTVPKGKFGQLILDLPFFAPRYTLSRFQLLNMTLNPVAYYNMPPRARKIIAKQAARFYGTTAAVFALAALAGASINWDPDDDDFMKIKIGNTKFDIFVGALPIAKAIIKIVHSAIRTKGGTANRLPGEIFLDALYAAGRLARGKLSPLFSLGVDYGLGEDYVGQEFSWQKALVSRVTPLMMNDMYEAYKLDGWTGAARNFVPGMVGLGISTYKSRPERPETEAEKLASKMVAWGIPDNGPDTPERKSQKDLAADLKARSRKGEDVTKEADDALAQGKISKWQRSAISGASKKSLLVDSAEGLPLTEQKPYFLKVWEIASPEEKKELEPIFAMKMKDLEKKGNLSPEFRQRLEAAGGRIAGDVPMPDMVKQAFKKFDIPVPDVGRKLVLTKKADPTELDMSEYEKYRKATLQRIYDQVENVMKTDEYKDADADRQQEMLEKIINRSRTIERKQTKHQLRGQPPS